MIGKPRGSKGMRGVWVYDPEIKRKRYVGSRPKVGTRNGDPDLEAKALEAVKETEFSKRGHRRSPSTWREYSERWLDVKHGPGTKRPTSTSKAHNTNALKSFLAVYGDRRRDDPIPRDEALDWALTHAWNARAVSAMFNDAVNENLLDVNPFANRQHEQGRGRRDIAPITEDELEKLGELALEHWGPGEYGPMCRAWLLMAGWVGPRPGEMWNLQREDLNLREGMVRFHRIKGGRQVEWVVLPDPAKQALLDMGIPLKGLVFTGVQGQALSKGGSRYYWDPVRVAFQTQLAPARRRELLAGRDNLDLYELRHFCGSLLADRGRSAIEIAQQLGNSPQVCEQTYIHGYRDRIHDRNRAAFDMNVRTLRAVDGQQKGNIGA